MTTVIKIFYILLAYSQIYQDPYITNNKILNLTNNEQELVNHKGNSTCDECDHVIKTNQFSFDGDQLNIKPGDIIGIASGIRGKIIFRNIQGTKDKPVKIINCDGNVIIESDGNGILLLNSSHFRLTGTDIIKQDYGIQIRNTPKGAQGIVVSGRSSDFEIDHIKIHNTGFSGIMVKTDPSCKTNTYERGKFTMYNILIHNNFIHDIPGEGLYIGNSFYTGTKGYCGYVQYPHEIRNIKIFNNTIKNSGWEAIQLGCAVDSAEIFDNYIFNFGTQNKKSQNNGIQVGLGTTGKVYNNYIEKGPGAGIVIQGIGNNLIFNNIILNVDHGINVNVRPTPLDSDVVSKGFLGGVYIINNTIGNANIGISEYINRASGNTLYNNHFLNVKKWNGLKPYTAWDVSHNLVENKGDEYMYNLKNRIEGSINIQPMALGQGKDVSCYEIVFDFNRKERLPNNYNVGAIEF